MNTQAQHGRFGQLAMQYSGVRLPLIVCKSAAGFYIGTYGEDGPCSRESAEYFKSQDAAEKAMESGNWTQRLEP